MAATDGPHVRAAGPAPPPVRSKAILFCPSCDHRSRFDGDWDVVEADGTSRYLCPECGTEITVRSTFADGDAGEKR